MSPELINAVRERVEKNFPKEAIYEEMRAAGYDDDMIGSVYDKVTYESDLGVSPIPEANSEAFNSMVTLPPFWSLFKESFFYTLKRKDLIGWNLLLVLAILVTASLVVFSFTYNIGIGFILALISLISSVIVTMIVGLAIHFIIAKDSFDYSVSLKEGWNWARKNLFWSGLWVLLLFSFITQGAVSLFFIPFIVIGPWLSFMIYSYTNENFKGLSAVFRARELGKGNWEGLLIRKVFFWLMLLVPVVFIAGLPIFMTLGDSLAMTPSEIGSFSHIYSNLPVIMPLAFILFIYGIFTSIWSIRFNVLLFKHISAERPVNEESGKGTDKWKYIVLIIAGLLLSGTSTEETEKFEFGDMKYDNAKERAIEMRDEKDFQDFIDEMEEVGVDTEEFIEEVLE